MIAFFTKRLFNMALVLTGVVVLNFLLFFARPGDSTNLFFRPGTDRQTLETMREKMGLEKPLHQQFLFWCSHILRGDWGYSWAKHRPVQEILNEAIPATIQLVVLALFVNFVLGCLLAIYTTVSTRKFSDSIINFSSLLVYVTPPFWLALFFIYIFSEKLGLLPASGMNSNVIHNATWLQLSMDRLFHLVLPVAVLGLTGAAATFRIVRANMQSVMMESFVLFARAKGLTIKRIYFFHIFKNALLPVVTLLGLYFPLMLSGVFIIEVIFAWPGMGQITYEAVYAKDFPVIMAVNLIAAVMVIIGNLLSDLLYQFVDPRIKSE